MTEKRFRLTPQLRQQIIASIRSGGYPHVSAEAWGVPRDVFEQWLRRGGDLKAREPYLSFTHEVRAAQAQARLRAELAVFEHDPKVWLEHGPGREGADNPGWSVSVKPAESAPQTRNALLDPELLRLFRVVRQVLVPYPDARARVAQALADLGLDPAASTRLCDDNHDRPRRDDA